MAQFVVRRVDDLVAQKLRTRAKAHGRSTEDEIRHILRAAVAGKAPKKTGLGSAIVRRFTGLGLTRDVAELRGQAVRAPEFDE